MSKPNTYVPESKHEHPEVSPTGAPLIPPAYVPYAAAAVAGAAVVQQVAEPGSTPGIIASVLLAIGAVLGIASPGMRKRR